MLAKIKQKLLSSFNLLLYEKCVPNILMVSKTKSILCIPQTATFTPFRTPIPEISHLLKFSLNPEKREKILKLLTITFMELTFSRNKMCHQDM